MYKRQVYVLTTTGTIKMAMAMIATRIPSIFERLLDPGADGNCGFGRFEGGGVGVLKA